MNRTQLTIVAVIVGLGITAIANAARNASGTMSLASGNPVTTGTTITSTWANNTLSDIATEITDSLSRSNKGAMLGNLELVAGADTPASPALTWDGDEDMGLYRIGADNMGVGMAGAKVLDISATGLGVTGTTLSGDGTVSLPGIGFKDDTNTGLYRIGADNPGLAVNGAAVCQWTANGNRCVDGAVTTPAYSFTSDTNTGIYRIGADNLGVAANGAKVLDVATTGLSVTGTTTSSDQVIGKGGAAIATPAFTFASDLDTGLYHDGANECGLAINGASMLHVGTNTVTASGTLTVNPSSGVAVVATGNGASAGATLTGGATSGRGATIQGGAPNGVGAVITGDGTGNGITVTGGDSDGTGISATGGATNGKGAVLAGAGTGVGLQCSNGTAATGGTRQDAISVTNGDIDMSGVANATSTTSISERLTPSNIIKAWVSVQTGTPTVLDAFNVASVTELGDDLVVTIAADMSSGSYAAICNANDGGTSAYIATAHNLAAGSFQVDATAHDGTDPDLSTAGEVVYCIVVGNQ